MAESEANAKKPTIVIIVGMAGSGKTCLLQRINAHVNQFNIPSYLINLDPAVLETPYDPNIDIRDVVNYKEIMKEHGLGPNGGILTSLNLFATRFDQVLTYIDNRAEEVDYVFIDTPGQIEVFTWSASGQIITEALASTYPTLLLYVVDTPRCTDCVTFMSNMTYACSMMYKTQLPFLIAFNKNDIVREHRVMEWMKDYDKFKEDCTKNTKGYVSTLTMELALVMEEFYINIKSIGVSAVSGYGIHDMFEAFGELRVEYFKEFWPIIEARMKKREEEKNKKKEDDLARLEKDFASMNTEDKSSKTPVDFENFSRGYTEVVSDFGKHERPKKRKKVQQSKFKKSRETETVRNTARNAESSKMDIEKSRIKKDPASAKVESKKPPHTTTYKTLDYSKWDNIESSSDEE